MDFSENIFTIKGTRLGQLSQVGNKTGTEKPRISRYSKEHMGESESSVQTQKQ